MYDSLAFLVLKFQVFCTSEHTQHHSQVCSNTRLRSTVLQAGQRVDSMVVQTKGQYCPSSYLT